MDCEPAAHGGAGAHVVVRRLQTSAPHPLERTLGGHVGQVPVQRERLVHARSRRGRAEPRDVLADVCDRGKGQEGPGHERRAQLHERGCIQGRRREPPPPLRVGVEARVDERGKGDCAESGGCLGGECTDR